jgi:hypothetical protein
MDKVYNVMARPVFDMMSCSKRVFPDPFFSGLHAIRLYSVDSSSSLICTTWTLLARFSSSARSLGFYGLALSDIYQTVFCSSRGVAVDRTIRRLMFYPLM